MAPARQQLRRYHILSEINGRGEQVGGGFAEWFASFSLSLRSIVAMPLPHLRRRYVLAIGVVVLVGAGAGSAAIVGGPAADALDPLWGQPDRYVTNGIDRPSEFAGQTPGEILNQLVQLAGGDVITDAQIGSAPADFQATESGNVPQEVKDGKWAYFTVKAPCECSAADSALWRAELISGALRDALHANGDYLVASRATLLLPDGTKAPSSVGCCGNVIYDQQFNTPSVDGIRSSIEQGARGTSLSIKSVDVVTADQPAPLVIATTDEDPTQVVSNLSSLTHKLFGNPPDYEGYYLEIRDAATDKPIAIAMTSFRIGAGTEWMRPDLACERFADPSFCKAHANG